MVAGGDGGAERAGGPDSLGDGAAGTGAALTGADSSVLTGTTGPACASTKGTGGAARGDGCAASAGCSGAGAGGGGGGDAGGDRFIVTNRASGTAPT